MIPNDVIPGNATREHLGHHDALRASTEEEERQLKALRREQGHDLPVARRSRARPRPCAWNAGCAAYKIGSGECNNYPLIEHIASYGKPVILSTGMNDLGSIAPAVEILRAAPACRSGCLHCTSMYPTPYEQGAARRARAIWPRAFPDAVLGLSDHSLGNYTCFAAVALGAQHPREALHVRQDAGPGRTFRSRSTRRELRRPDRGHARGASRRWAATKDILPEEQPTIDFAYASVVVDARRSRTGEPLTTRQRLGQAPRHRRDPGTRLRSACSDGAPRRATSPKDAQLAWSDIGEVMHPQARAAQDPLPHRHARGLRQAQAAHPAACRNPPRFEYQIFATGMHMLARYGSTVLRDREGRLRQRLPVHQPGQLGTGHRWTSVLATHDPGPRLTTSGEFPPDLIVVHGDRVETLAGAIVGLAQQHPRRARRGRRALGHDGRAASATR